jgi:hypothetical protein
MFTPQRQSLATYIGPTLGATVLALTSACGTGAAPPGWEPIEATLSVEHLPLSTPAEDAEPVSLPLADAPSQLPFAFGLPAWTPEGFVLQDEAEAVLPAESSQYASITLTWQKADEETITLQASVNAEASSQLAGAGTTEQVTVNGHPATLTRLGLKSAPRGLSLKWSQNGVSYTLTAEGHVLSAEEMVRMAESVP